jgi:hypothetical protein
LDSAFFSYVTKIKAHTNGLCDIILPSDKKSAEEAKARACLKNNPLMLKEKRTSPASSFPPKGHYFGFAKLICLVGMCDECRGSGLEVILAYWGDGPELL